MAKSPKGQKSPVPFDEGSDDDFGDLNLDQFASEDDDQQAASGAASPVPDLAGFEEGFEGFGFDADDVAAAASVPTPSRTPSSRGSPGTGTASPPPGPPARKLSADQEMLLAAGIGACQNGVRY